MFNKAIPRLTLLVSIALLLNACAPEIGSEAWCKDQAEKPKGDWTINESTAYAKHCLLK